MESLLSSGKTLSTMIYAKVNQIFTVANPEKYLVYNSLSNSGKIYFGINAEAIQNLRVADPAELEKLWSFYCSDGSIRTPRTQC